MMFGIRRFFGRLVSRDRKPVRIGERAETQSTSISFFMRLMRTTWSNRLIQCDQKPPFRASEVLEDILAVLRRVLLRNHSWAGEAPQTSRAYLEELPVELVAHIASFLPAESAVCLSLVSKFHFGVLSPRVEMKFNGPNTGSDQKKRFLRLLEVDVPELMACHLCNRMYPWKSCEGWRAYACPRRFGHGVYREHVNCLRLLCKNGTNYVHRETVDAFLRGYERGPAYGPQLHDLRQNCISPDWSATKGLSRSTEARVVGGRLLLSKTYGLSVPIHSPDRDLFEKEVYKFHSIGCWHSYRLPSFIMDVADHFRRDPNNDGSDAYSSCPYCATDARVRVRQNAADHLVVQVQTWQCLGGRDYEAEHQSIQALFSDSAGFYPQRDELKSPTRNLEKLYNERAGSDLHLPFVESVPKDSQERQWFTAWPHYSPGWTASRQSVIWRADTSSLPGPSD